MLHCTVYNEWTGDLSIGPFTNDRRRTNKQLTLNHLLTCAQLMRSWCAYFSAMQMHSENVCDKTTKSVCWTIFESVARNGPSESINGHTRLVVYCFMQTTFRHQFMNIEWTIDVLWMRCIRIFCVRPGKFDFNRTSEYILSKNVLKFYGKFLFYDKTFINVIVRNCPTRIDGCVFEWVDKGIVARARAFCSTCATETFMHVSVHLCPELYILGNVVFCFTFYPLFLFSIENLIENRRAGADAPYWMHLNNNWKQNKFQFYFWQLMC